MYFAVCNLLRIISFVALNFPRLQASAVQQLQLLIAIHTGARRKGEVF